MPFDHGSSTLSGIRLSTASSVVAQRVRRIVIHTTRRRRHISAGQEDETAGSSKLPGPSLAQIYSSAYICKQSFGSEVRGMARKRKVENLLALAVLATVYQRPMHRYEMASVMRARGKDQDMDIKFGSLYTVVQNMAKHGFLEAIGNTRQGARPERTVYQITRAGKQEMLDW